jgi:hypothetical protein
MLGYCTISAIEGSHVDQTVTGINALNSDGRILKISQINTHTYGGSQHALLKTIADQQVKKLWQSESGPVNVTQTGWDNNLEMAKRVIYDMNVLKPVAWIDWQLLDQGVVWGLIQYNLGDSIWKHKNYYARMHFSRFMKPGYTIVHNDNESTLTALNPDSTELVVVTCNTSLVDENYKLDLSLFGAIGKPAEVYKTSSGLEGIHSLASSYDVYTYQTISGITNGTYTAKAWIKSNFAQNQHFFEVKDFGGTTLTADILPNLSTWTQITISNIEVTNGKCTIGFKSNASAGAWITFDDIEFYKNTSPASNLITNPGFDNDLATQTPSGWSTSGNNPDANYTQTGGVSANENCYRIADITIADNKLSYTATKRSIHTLVIPVNK